MDVPQKVKDRIAEIILENEQHEGKLRKAEEAERKRLEKIRCMRVALEDDLSAAAHRIMNWVYLFWNNPEIHEVFKIRNSVCIFGSRYLDCEPTTDKHAWAVIEVTHSKEIIYREQYHTSMGGSSRLKKTLGDFACFDERQALHRALIDNLHPDYLLQFAEAVRTGKVWDHVLRFL